MDPVTLSLAAGGANIFGGLLGNILGSGQNAQALQNYQNAVNAYQNLQSPQQLTQLLNYNKYQDVGQLNPTLQSPINQQTSALANVQTNPALMSAQMSALAQMQQQAQTGMTPQAQQMLNQIKLQNAAQTQGATQAALQQQQMMGNAGQNSGAALAAQLQAAQSGAQNASASGNQVAAQAQQNALNALANYGGMAQGIQGQQFNQAATMANAQDQMNRFNIQNQLGIQQQNVGAQNQAQQYNLAQQQALANQNTGMANQALQQQLAGYQQQYQNQLAQAQGLSGVYGQQANALLGQSNATRQGAANVGAGAGAMLGSLANYGQQQANNDQQQNNFNTFMNAAYPNAPGSGSFTNYAPGSNAPGPYAAQNGGNSFGTTGF